MTNDAIRLSLKFFKEVKGFPLDSQGRVKANESYKISVMSSIEQILNGGMSYVELASYFERYKLDHRHPEEVYSVEEILSFYKVQVRKKDVKRDPNNLLEPGTFYYHPALQVAPKPPVTRQLDDGSFVSSYETEPFFLEMKESFTYSDLISYFYYRMGRQPEGSPERDTGAFKHLLNSYDIDLLMFTIDQARAMAEDLSRPIPRTPFEIRDYIDEGRMIMEERMNTCYMEGINHVIPRTK